MNQDKINKVQEVLKKDIPFLKVNDEDLKKINNLKELRAYLEDKLLKEEAIK